MNSIKKKQYDLGSIVLILNYCWSSNETLQASIFKNIFFGFVFHQQKGYQIRKKKKQTKYTLICWLPSTKQRKNLFNMLKQRDNFITLIKSNFSDLSPIEIKMLCKNNPPKKQSRKLI
jgi:hypothetical protein